MTEDDLQKAISTLFNVRSEEALREFLGKPVSQDVANAVAHVMKVELTRLIHEGLVPEERRQMYAVYTTRYDVANEQLRVGLLKSIEYDNTVKLWATFEVGTK